MATSIAVAFPLFSLFPLCPSTLLPRPSSSCACFAASNAASTAATKAPPALCSPLLGLLPLSLSCLGPPRLRGFRWRHGSTVELSPRMRRHRPRCGWLPVYVYVYGGAARWGLGIRQAAAVVKRGNHQPEKGIEELFKISITYCSSSSSPSSCCSSALSSLFVPRSSTFLYLLSPCLLLLPEFHLILYRMLALGSTNCTHTLTHERRQRWKMNSGREFCWRRTPRLPDGLYVGFINWKIHNSTHLN
jgi:hypothetical protein